MQPQDTAVITVCFSMVTLHCRLTD